MNSRKTTVTVASRATRSRPAPASVSSVPITSRLQTTSALNSRPTHGLRRVEWILANTPGTTSSRAMP